MTQSAGKIDEQAVEWAVRLAAASLSASEQAQLDAWLKQDVRHRGALLKARAQWLDVDRVAALRGVQHLASQPSLPAARSRRSVLAAALGGAAALALGWSGLAPADEYFSTAIGEMRRIPLSDGSMLMLNTNSQVCVHYESGLRLVTLLRGEALFEVKPDIDRPFLVRADQWQMRALGTAFGVRLRDDDQNMQQVDVTVSRGEVELQHTSRSGDKQAPLRLMANQESRLPATTVDAVQVSALPAATLEQRFAWLNGMVAFSGESLSDAIAEINRHNRRQLEVDDAALAQQPIVGAFRATDIDAFAAAAAAALNAQVVVDDQIIHLQPRR